MHILHSPPPVKSYKHATKQKVLDFWNRKFRAEVLELTSLSHFNAEFMSLCRPHPIWTSAGSSPFEVKKATVQARMLSGRYRTCWLRRYWSGDLGGMCRVCNDKPGTLQHIAAGECPGLAQAVTRARCLWEAFLVQNPVLYSVVQQYSSGDSFLSFLLDPTTKPSVISLSQTHGSHGTTATIYGF